MMLFINNREEFSKIATSFARNGKIKSKAKTPIPAYNATEEIGTTAMPDKRK